LVLSEAPRGFWTGEDILCWTRGAVPWGSFPLLTLVVAESENRTFELQVSPRQYLRPVPDSGGDGEDAGLERCYKYAIVPSESGKGRIWYCSRHFLTYLKVMLIWISPMTLLILLARK
jgi:hypothetical protein